MSSDMRPRDSVILSPQQYFVWLEGGRWIFMPNIVIKEKQTCKILKQTPSLMFTLGPPYHLSMSQAQICPGFKRTFNGGLFWSLNEIVLLQPMQKSSLRSLAL